MKDSEKKGAWTEQCQLKKHAHWWITLTTARVPRLLRTMMSCQNHNQAKRSYVLLDNIAGELLWKKSHLFVDGISTCYIQPWRGRESIGLPHTRRKCWSRACAREIIIRREMDSSSHTFTRGRYSGGLLWLSGTSPSSDQLARAWQIASIGIPDPRGIINKGVLQRFNNYLWP